MKAITGAATSEQEIRTFFSKHAVATVAGAYDILAATGTDQIVATASFDYVSPLKADNHVRALVPLIGEPP